MSKNFKIYKSSAGSGKTYTLVKEYLGIVLSQEKTNRYRNILAITFTNKAAAEMKERILEHLKSLSAPVDSPHFDKGLLEDYSQSLNLSSSVIQERAQETFQSLLHNYSDLKVSTIDKFTHKIIRAFARDLDLQQDFDVEMDVDFILQSAIHQVIEQVGEDQEISETLKKVTKEQINNEKTWNIEQNLFDFTKTFINEDNFEFLEQLQQIELSEIKKGVKQILNTKKELELKVKTIAKDVVNVIDQSGVEKGDFPYGTFYQFFVDLSNGSFEKYHEIPARVLSAFESDAVDWLSKKAAKIKASNILSVETSIRDCCHQLLAIRDSFFTYQLLAIHAIHLELIQHIYNQLDKLKEENTILLISDFNKIISEQIKDQPAPFIYEKIGERYKNIMIDEFQDTSILQWQNILPLIDNSLAQGDESLVVGDAKQAIYRFRGGKVEQFVQLPHIYEHKNDPLLLEREQALIYNHEPKVLDTNYRSQKEVVSFNNWFFEELKNNLTQDYQQIYEASSQNVRKGFDKGYVEVSFIPHKEVEDLDEAYVEQTKNKIEDSVKHGYQYKDIAVLVRDNKKSTLVADYLLSKSIPVITSESLLIHTNKEVHFLVNFLKLIHQPLDNQAKLSLVKLLVSQDKLSEILLNNLIPKRRKNNINFDHILKSFDKRLDDISKLDVSVYDLAEHIIREFGLHKSGANPFLICLLDRIYETTKKRNDLSYFIKYWEDYGEKISISTPEDADAVTIVTIHKSKGLQYPVVILPFANWEFTKRGYTPLRWVATPEELQPTLPIAVLPLKKEVKVTAYGVLAEEEQQINKLDNFNLLYVALTRPEQALFIISDTNVKNKEGWKENAMNSYLYKVCSTHSNFSNEELILGTIEVIKTNKSEEKEQDEWELTNVQSSDWREKVKISEVYKKHWVEGTYLESIEYGNAVHATLGLMDIPEDLDKALEKLLKSGQIKLSWESKIKEEVQNLMKNEIVSKWFNGSGVLKKEETIITKEGGFLIPDRVILYNHKAIVVDYKTGNKEKKHIDQINQYEEVLNEMGYDEVEKYLLYTKDVEILKIDE